jgi:hypothetical protein
MSSFSFSDFTVAGAYVSAVAAANRSGRRSAERHSEPSEAPCRPKYLSGLVRRIVTAVSERRSAALRLASRRV